MHFALTSEQTDLQTTVRRLLAEKAPVAAMRTQQEAGQYDTDLWNAMADMGLHGLAIPEEYNGFGATFEEVSIVCQEMGRYLHYSPYFATVVLAAEAIIQSGDTDAMGRYLPGIAAGTTTASVVIDASQAAGHFDMSALTAMQGTDDYWISGTVDRVLTGNWADLLIVPANTSAGPSLMVVDTASATGLAREDLPTLDATRPLTRVTFDAAPATRVGPAGAAADPIRRTLMKAAVAMGAEEIGGAQACLDMATAYARIRETFGRPIGSYQAIKHMCAEMFLSVEIARATNEHASWCLTTNHPGTSFTTASSKTLSSEAYIQCASRNIQIHGGIGFTWEHDAHLFLRRARSSSQLFGSPAQHLETIAESMVGDAA